jgi:hypothetical protein
MAAPEVPRFEERASAAATASTSAGGSAAAAAAAAAAALGHTSAIPGLEAGKVGLCASSSQLFSDLQRYWLATLSYDRATQASKRSVGRQANAW